MLRAALFKHSKSFPKYFSGKYIVQCKAAQQVYEQGHLTIVHHV